jgi:hypothetical protein
MPAAFQSDEELSMDGTNTRTYRLNNKGGNEYEEDPADLA